MQISEVINAEYANYYFIYCIVDVCIKSNKNFLYAHKDFALFLW